MEPDDGESQKGNRVLGSKHVFLVHVNVEEFVERFDVADAPVIGAGPNNAIKAGAAPSGTGRVQPKRAVWMSNGAKVDVGAPVARKCDFNARIGLARNLYSRVEAGVDYMAGRFQSPKPTGVSNAPRS